MSIVSVPRGTDIRDVLEQFPNDVCVYKKSQRERRIDDLRWRVSFGLLAAVILGATSLLMEKENRDKCHDLFPVPDYSPPLPCPPQNPYRQIITPRPVQQMPILDPPENPPMRADDDFDLVAVSSSNSSSTIES